MNFHKEYLSEFLNHLRSDRGLSENTAITYSHHLEAYGRFLQEANSGPIIATSKLTNRYVGELSHRGLSPTTRFCATIAIRSFHRFLVEKGYAEFDPTVGLILPELKISVVEPLSVEEVERLLSAPSQSTFLGTRDQAILEILYCGLRIGEAIGLNVEHLHLDDGYIKVKGKGSKERLVPIGTKAIKSLRAYLQRRTDKSGNGCSALFLTRSGTRLGKNGFWRKFKRYSARAGITRRVYPHLLRHSFAVHMLQGKADLRSLQLLLGHSNLTSTQRYLNLNHQALRETCQQAHPRF